jgi:hypothetical protein
MKDLKILRDECLMEMCRRVGVDYTKVDTEDPEWFTRHTWTAVEQDDFKVWLVKKLRANKVLKKTATETADLFILNWGWKVKEG